MKWIYLDQNKWIDLAKAEVSKADGKQYREVLALARTAVAAGKACFPLSFAHMHETARATKPAQRRLLAGLMAELSGGYVVKAHQAIVGHGIRQAVRREFGLAPLDDESAFARGMEAAVHFDLARIRPSLTDAQIETLRSSIDSREAWIDLLSYKLEQPRIAGTEAIRRTNEEWALARNHDRTLLATSSDEECRRVFAARITIHFASSVQGALREIGRTWEEWGGIGPERLTAFWLGIPCVRANIELELAQHKNKSRPWVANDLSDISFLGIALPHCAAVVTEKLWVRLAEQTKLDRDFDTKVLRDIRAIEVLLRD